MSIRRAQGGDRDWVELIAVDVGDENQIGRRQACEVRGLGWIDVDAFVADFDEQARVVNGRDFYRIALRSEGVRRA